MSTLASIIQKIEGFGQPTAPSITNGNNPGAIQYGPYSVSQGAIGQNPNGTAIFPDLASGQSALESLLNSKYNGGATTPASLAASYEGEPSPTYAQSIANELGIGVNDTIPPSTLGPSTSGLGGIMTGPNPTQGELAGTSGTGSNSLSSAISSLLGYFMSPNTLDGTNALNGINGSVSSLIPSWIRNLSLTQIVALILGIAFLIAGVFFLKPVQSAIVQVTNTGKKAASLFA